MNVVFFLGGDCGDCVQGNVVLWKPSHSAVLSSYLVFKILREAGLPPGVINFVPSAGRVFGEVISSSYHLAGVNFTGSAELVKCSPYVIISRKIRLMSPVAIYIWLE